MGHLSILRSEAKSQIYISFSVLEELLEVCWGDDGVISRAERGAEGRPIDGQADGREADGQRPRGRYSN